MSYYPEPDSYIINKIKVEPDSSNYATKKEIELAADIDTSDLTAKKILLL